MNDKRLKLIIITGPTASGKSSITVETALRYNGEIINADSMQVYRGMDIGTAKQSIEERRGVPHHLLDVVNPDDDFNASIYRSLAEPIIQDITSRNKICFVVGGTGLYIKTLLGGLLKCPPTDYDLRESLYQDLEKHGLDFLHRQLKTLDPESALTIHSHDKTRIIRALEIIQLTQKPFSMLVKEHEFNERPYQSIKICLHMDRQKLYQRINNRSLLMIEKGLIDETQGLLNKGYHSGLKAMNALGYRHAIRFLNQEWDMDELVRKLQTDTRRYAKRQLTWFRADPDMIWVDPLNKANIKKVIEKFI